MVARVLRLDALPQPADAADALAIALCHGWRRDTPTGEAARAGLTPAQRAWADAERAARPEGLLRDGRVSIEQICERLVRVVA